MGEVSKARERRESEGWFEKYAPEQKSGIDIGCQNDPLNQTFRRFDRIFGDGDATLMQGIDDETFFTVHASHVLEHIDDPITAVRNWFRILQTGGHLIIVVPHRDLYERKKELPSDWNYDHKCFWLPDESDPPHTRSLKEVVFSAIPNANIVSLKVLDEGFDNSVPHNFHSIGEYSIEAIIKK
jgi:ubiquinone/menaquinone biosynthesis C-methylase UbiE